MFLENLDPARSSFATALECKRSLSGDFVFLSQDDSVGFAAEACIDVLRSANRLTALASIPIRSSAASRRSAASA